MATIKTFPTFCINSNQRYRISIQPKVQKISYPLQSGPLLERGRDARILEAFDDKTVTLINSAASPNKDLQTLLDSARPFLRGELDSVDTNLYTLVSVLKSVGAAECWHKHGSFLDHLQNVYRTLKLWKANNDVCLCGLFHSAYSNSYANLAIFDPSTSRDTVRNLIGEAAERLTYLFCVINRQSLIYDHILFHFDDLELIAHLNDSEDSLQSRKDGGIIIKEEGWRRKLNSILPENGIIMKHIRTGEDVVLSRRVVAIFILLTIADFSDQFFGFQDTLFDNLNGRFEFSVNNCANALWPGDGKPGLWMNSLSRMAAVYTLIAREEEIFVTHEANYNELNRDENIDLIIPPIFNNCTRVLEAEYQIMARDFYWKVVCEGSKEGLGSREDMLRMCVRKNSFVGEPHVVLAQICLSEGRFEEAEMEAEKGLKLLLEWGSPWDKRISWEGWIAWSRVLLMKAKERAWPSTSWGILNLGLVR